MSISAINTTAQPGHAPTQTVSVNARNVDGDYKAPAAGRVKDSDGDYKPISQATALPASGAVAAALGNLKIGG